MRHPRYVLLLSSIHRKALTSDKLHFLNKSTCMCLCFLSARSFLGDFVLLTTQAGDANLKWLQLFPGSNWTYLQVAGSDVNVTLSERYRDTSKVYVITLGSQKDIIELWRDSESIAEAHAPNLLELQTLKDFWVSWESGRIQIGQGRFRGQRTVIDFEDQRPYDVSAIALSGANKAEWKLLLDQGKPGSMLASSSLS